MVKFLLERIAPVHIDTESISALVKQVNKSIQGTADDDEEGVPTEEAIRADLELLKVLSFTHPVSFHSAETFDSRLGCLKMEDEKTAESALLILKEDYIHIDKVNIVKKDECYQVRQAFAQKLHRGLCCLRLPLEYLAVFALCAKEPMKERRAHARQCLVKNNLRQEYLKQHAAVSDKLFSLLPEYVVPYAIHLLVHDPDYVKVQDIEQQKDIKEQVKNQI
ncbi:sister chromatid cohesion protein PDS5 homolog B-like [Esox lucius]|uniref:sister chromatid cohesion protein PDS5 homolog B-like n=1 Tax=Esox lucius TaxID=8010 RepID=UPI001476BD77|nr:sister chromatid cohesion protein PDS5 homolog B-like [Esox lucius]